MQVKKINIRKITRIKSGAYSEPCQTPKMERFAKQK